MDINNFNNTKYSRPPSFSTGQLYPAVDYNANSSIAGVLFDPQVTDPTPVGLMELMEPYAERFQPRAIEPSSIVRLSARERRFLAVPVASEFSEPDEL